MGFLQFLRNKAENRPEPLAPPTVVVSIPDVDDDTETAHEAAKPELGYAEGQCFIIEYVSASGEQSTRRITVWQVIHGAGGVPCLMAKCHERKANRQFRIDRIRAVIDLDGEVFEPPTEFLIEAFGMDPVFAESAETGEVYLPEFHERMEKELAAKQRWADIKKAILPELKILSALSLADGYMQVDERREIADFLLSRVASLSPSQAEEKRIIDLIKRQRPSSDAIDKAFDELATGSDERREALMDACVRVVEADGEIHDDEVSFLREQGIRFY